MKIMHHLDDATIIAYASGTLGEAHTVVAAAHLAYCMECRSAVRQAEAIGGEMLLDQDVKGVSDVCRSATLASLDALVSAPVRKVKSTPVGNVPQLVNRILGGKTLDEIAWKMKAPGVSVFDIPTSDGRTRLRLLSIGPGRAMPEHSHGGDEIALILRGSYTDHIGRFQVGDVADVDSDVEHQPVVDAGSTCICLVATEAPTRFKSFWARLAQPFIGI